MIMKLYLIMGNRMPIRFTPRQLDAFIAVAELSSFTRAAARLHLTPSAVSSLIGELEAALEFDLFARNTRNVSLTAQGRIFLPSAMAAQRQMRLAEIAAEDVRDRSYDVVRLAAPLVVASMILPPLIAEFTRTHPRARIRIRDTPVVWLADRVESGEADLAVGPEGPAGEQVEAKRVFSSPWVLWCAADHAFAKSAKLRWPQLQATELCMAGTDHEHSLAPMLNSVPESRRITPVQIVENISTALGMAAAGMAVTVSPAYVGALATPLGLVMRPLVEPAIQRHVALFMPSRRTQSAAALVFADFLVEQLGKSQRKRAA
jgi:DNA-binding transcriptional LysR family regulator